MNNYIVTVKLPKNPDHNPHNKLIGNCPVSDKVCTDVTGEHHSFLREAASPADARNQAFARFGHVTRVEEVLDDE